MKVRTFSADQIEKVRRKARKISQDFSGNATSGKIPDKGPNDLLRLFSTLNMKDGFELVAYQFHQGGNGNAVVCVVPTIDKGSSGTTPDIDFYSHIGYHLQPSGWTEYFKEQNQKFPVMAMIEGDHSLMSFLHASIFMRELSEFGAMWHGCDWSMHRVVSEDPSTDVKRMGDFGEQDPSLFEMTWEMERPITWKPQVTEGEGSHTVEFYSYSMLGTEGIYRHVDVYSGNDYRCESECHRLAYGKSGMIF